MHDYLNEWVSSPDAPLCPYYTLLNIYRLDVMAFQELGDEDAINKVLCIPKNFSSNHSYLIKTVGSAL